MDIWTRADYVFGGMVLDVEHKFSFLLRTRYWMNS